MRPTILLAIAITTLLGSVAACVSSSEDTSPVVGEPGRPVAADAGEPAVADAAVAEDAATPAPLPPVSGTLEAKAAGQLPTTASLGAVALAGGSAQWRARPSGGGVLTVTLVEAAPKSRTFELTITDDAGTLDAAETFPARAASGAGGLRHARVETWTTDDKAWGTNGDGTVAVNAISATSVTLDLMNVGQFVLPPGSGDTWILSGTVTVAVAPLSPSSGSAASLVLSNPQNEPISNDAPNLASASTPVAGTAGLGEEPFPFTNARRAIRVADAPGGTQRRVLVAFPSGHLPHVGQTIALSTFDRVTVTLVEGASFQGDVGEKVWEADQGTAVVQSRTATSLVLALQGARLQSESQAAKGLYTLDGTLTVALP